MHSNVNMNLKYNFAAILILGGCVFVCFCSDRMQIFYHHSTLHYMSLNLFKIVAITFLLFELNKKICVSILFTKIHIIFSWHNLVFSVPEAQSS